MVVLEAQKLNVVSERRSVTPTGNVVSDSFDPWETHIYTTSTECSGLKTVHEITAIIEAEYDRLRKPGNLAFQRWSNQSVDIAFSSRKGDYPPEPWHICDGVSDVSGYEVRFETLHTWTDGTPNTSPDWLELQFRKSHRIGRVEVYPFKQSLRDYTVQAYVDDAWQDMDKVTDQNSDHLTHTFNPVLTDRIRLFVTATNGPDAVVSEVEIYNP